ncbi:MAG: hypothetical protein QOF76_4682 [Solirubrobacteraceae bacterium]|nr:hypothetical protein [Solirubrobacteraceae bacterium]
MTVFAHVGGVPVEELLPSAGMLLVARGWLAVHLRRHRHKD